MVATEWEEFRHLDLAALLQAMAYPVVVDGRNLFDDLQMSNAGFSYYPTGRPRRLRQDDGTVGANLLASGGTAPDR